MRSPTMDQSYQSYGGMDRPLFGETNKKVSVFQAYIIVNPSRQNRQKTV